MSQQCEQHGINFIFVYTLEAHPGENFPAHRDIEQKLSHDQSLKDRLGVKRPILVDDLGGTGHQLYCGLANMTCVVAKSGRALFRSDWTDPPTIETALEYIQTVGKQRREDMPIVSLFAELVEYRWSDLAKHHEVLKQAGPQAMEDWEQSQRRSAQQSPRPGRIQL